MRKKQIFLIIIIAFNIVMAAPLLQAENSGVIPDGFTLVAENQYLRLFLEGSTTGFAVQNKESNQLWYSNPLRLAQEEKIARGRAKRKLRSQIQINYYAPGDQPRVMDNYNDSVQYKQFQITMLENGVRIDYTLGKEWDDQDFVPVMISRDRFEKMILGQIEDSAQRQFVKDQYVLVSLIAATAAQQEETEIAARELLGDYSLKSWSAELGQKKLFQLLVTQLVEHRADLGRLGEITREDFEQLINNPTYIQRDLIPKWDREDLIQIIKETGYRPEDVREDHRSNRLDLPTPNQTIFDIPIIYTLEEQSLVVSVPVNQIKYPLDLLEEGELVSYPLHSLEVLPYFGAAGPGQQGYILVPDGSGALIELNNNKKYARPYEQPLYGFDQTLKARTEKISSVEQSYLPVFGLKEEEKAFLAIVEQGDAIATVKADIAGRTSSYNTVSARFTTIPKAKVVLQTIDPDSFEIPTELNIYQARIYQDQIRIRYQFLEQAEADYVGMAKAYQGYLIEQGLTRLNPAADIPFYLEVIGAIEHRAVVMGAPRTIIKPLTSYNQTKLLMNELLEQQVSNIKVRYSGALQGGIKHVVPTELRLEKSLGDREGFLELRDELNKQNIDFFPDVSFLNIYQDRLFDGFRANKDAARFLDRKVAKSYDYNIASYQHQPDDFAYLLSPLQLERLVDRFFADYSQYQLGGVSLQKMGKQLQADYRDDPQLLVDRQEALAIIAKETAKIDQKYRLELMVEGGNAFILPFVDHILKAPVGGSNFTVLDRTIPFYQLVLHGFVNYAGQPFNFTPGYRKNILRSLETGASPYYLWTYSPSSLLKETDYDHFYSSYYADWLDEAGKVYQEINRVLQKLQGQRIIDHQRLQKQVYQTTYEDGTAIIVNYNQEPVWINGLQIKEEDYLIIREGEIR